MATLVPSVAPYEVDLGMHAVHRATLVQKLREGGTTAGLVVLEGGRAEFRHDTDHEIAFRQESFFQWAFGVKEPDFYGTIDVASGRSTLYVPRMGEVYRIWMGAIKTLAEWQVVYKVDEVRYVDEFAAHATALAPAKILLLSGKNTDSGSMAQPASFPGLADVPGERDLTSLFPVIVECRVIKSAAEIELLRYMSIVSSEAHIAVMQQTRPGLKEYQLEATFKHWCHYHGGSRFLSYTCICGTGNNASVLHYGHAGEPNLKEVKAGDLCLFDMGAEYHCYGSDITTTFPASGTFTADQRFIYEAVLATQLAAFGAMRPGVSYQEVHGVAYRALLEALRRGGLLKGEVEAMFAANVAAYFMPHGLGHFLGIDTHDCGGYAGDATPRPTQLGWRSLRTTRTLQPGMYITVEPGCYFIDHLLDQALADPAVSVHIDAAALARFRGFGGVRIEDDVLITATGIDNLTHAPRTVDDIEAVMAGRIKTRAELKKFY